MSQPFYVGMSAASGIDPSLGQVQFQGLTYMRKVPDRSANMPLWLRSDAGIAVNPGDNSQWVDQSPFANSASQSNAAEQPTAGLDSNNKPYMGFNHTGAELPPWMQLPDGMSDFSKGASIFIVARPNNGANPFEAESRFIDFGEGNSNDNIQVYMPTSTSVAFTVYQNANAKTVTATSSITQNNLYLIEAIHDGSNKATLFVNGVQKSQITDMHNIANVVRTNFLGKAYNSSKYFQGNIYEVIVVNRGVTDSERKDYEAYFYYKFGLLSTTPPPVAPTISAKIVQPAPLQPLIVTPATGAYPNNTLGGISGSGIIMNANPLSTISYTVNGGSSQTYTPGSVVSISGSSVIRAKATEGGVDSAEITVRILIDAAAPLIPKDGMSLWLRGDWTELFSTVGTSPKKVSSWFDLSGKDMHAAQSTDANRPTYLDTGGPNSKNGVTFSGSSQWLQLPSGFDSFLTGASIFVVTKPVDEGTNGRLIDFGNGNTTDNIQLFMQNDSTVRYRVYNGGQRNVDIDNVNNTDYQVLEVVHSGTTATTFLDRVQSDQSTTFNTIGNVPRSGNYIGRAFTAGNYYVGTIVELLIYNRPVTEAERTGIEAALKARYALSNVTAPTMPNPVINPASQVFVSDNPISVTITGSNNASIFYSTDGGTPTTPYTGPISIEPTASPGMTVKAKAVNSPYFQDSGIVSANFIYDPTSGVIADPELLIWLRSDAGVEIDGGGVKSWLDQSGNSLHAAQPNSTNRPTVTASAVNGKPAVTFNSANSQWMQFPQIPTSLTDFSNGLTIFLVGTTTGANGSRWLDWGNGATSDNIQFQKTSNSQYSLNILNGATSTSVGSTTLDGANFHLYEAVHNGLTTAQLLTDGTSQAINPSMNGITAINRDGNFLGKGYAATGNMLTGKIAELIVYDGDLTSERRMQIENYLKSRYAIGTPSAPKINPAVGAWPSTQEFTITADPGAVVLYSTDGTNPPTAAYNGPFQLNSSATIRAKATLNGQTTNSSAVIQIDENTRNLPRSNMTLWLKADMLPALSGSIATWPDISGAGNNAVGTSGSQPTFASNAVNSLPAIDFSATSPGDWLQLPTGFKNFSNGISMFAVLKTTASAVADARVLHLGTNSGGDTIALSLPSTSCQFWTSSSNSLSAADAVSTSAYKLIEINHTGRGACEIQPNNTQTPAVFELLQNPSSNNDRNQNFVGKSASGNILNGRIAEILLYDKSLSKTAAANVRAYLIGRYALGSPTVVIAPTITPAAGVYTANQEVSIGAFPGAAIHFTTDGTTPTGSSASYSVPFTVSKPTVIKAIAIQNSISSAVTTRFIDFAPETNSITRDGLAFWLKSDFGLVNDGLKASRWYDLSGTGNELDAFQSDSSKQPLFKDDYDFARITTGSSPTRFLELGKGFADFSSGLTFFAVTRPLSASGSDTWIFNSSNGATSDNIEVRDDPSNARARLRIRRGSTGDTIVTSTSTFPRNKFQILGCVQDGVGATGKIYIDGVQRQSGTMLSANSITRLKNQIASSPTMDTDFFSGDYVEVLIYNRVLSDSERAAVEKSLAAKYQLPFISTLPAPTIYYSTLNFAAPLQVAISAPSGATIHFTTDGDTPTATSQLYVRPIDVVYPQTIKAIAVKNGTTSGVATATFTTTDSTLWPAPSTSDTRPLNLQLQLPTVGIPQ